MRIINCVLALKSYAEWKQNGGRGLWKPGGNVKNLIAGGKFMRKNSEPFMNSFSRTRALDSASSDLASYGDIVSDINEAVSEYLFLCFSYHFVKNVKSHLTLHLICRECLVI